MSNPVSTVNIDDVLSSIRRLVSDGTSSEANRTVENAPDRLILTPDHMVAEPASSGGDKKADPVAEKGGLAPLVLQPEDSVSATNKSIQKDTLEETIAALETQITESEENWEPDGSEAKTDLTWESVGVGSQLESDSAANVETPDADTVEASVLAASAAGAFRRKPEVVVDNASSQLPEFVSRLRHAEQHSNVEDGGTTDAAFESAEPTTAEDEDGPLILERAMETLVEAEIFDDFSELDINSTAIVPETAEHLDTPLDFGMSDGAAETKGSSNELEEGVEQTPTIEAAQSHLKAVETVVGGNAIEKVLDQSLALDSPELRQVVKEAIREELQGPLGERITRNVRKLVRREIHNILTTQEFD